MSRKTETITRLDALNCTDHLDVEDQDAFWDSLNQYLTGTSCEHITVDVDSGGRIDSESNPRPATEAEVERMHA